MPWQFDLCGGHLALDFANTVSQRRAPDAVERLPDYAALVSFARQTELISSARASGLLARAEREQAAVARVHAAAISLREALYDMFHAVAEGNRPRASDIDRLNAEIPRLRLDGDLGWTWRDEPEALDGFLGAVVRAAVELATSPDGRSRVHVCELPSCAWLFYDSSKNRSRRWCDMRVCGNRMKARRHYQRAREP